MVSIRPKLLSQQNESKSPYRREFRRTKLSGPVKPKNASSTSTQNKKNTTIAASSGLSDQ